MTLFQPITRSGSEPIPPDRRDPNKERSRSLTSGHLLLRNSLWSIVGRGAPLIIALVAIPILIHGLGTAKYGVLNLGWVVVGYLNLFDFGLGRALTLVVAEKLGTDDEGEVPSLFWKAMLLLIVLGILGGMAGILLSRLLAFSILNLPDDLQTETLHVFYLLSLWLPVQISESGLRGLLEAHHRFRLMGTLAMIVGAFAYIAPVSLLPFTHRLTFMIAIILLARSVVWITLFVHCLQALPAGNRFTLQGKTSVRAMLRVGGWMTISNIISPLMNFADRFLVGALLSVSAVAFYTAPFDLVIKMIIIPTATSAVVFPAFAASFGTARQQTAELFSRAVRSTFIVLFPIAVVITLFAKEILELWLGTDFSGVSTHLFQILAIGVLAKSLAKIPEALIQGGGRSDRFAQLQMIEFPIYLALMWFLVRPFGINGVAIAWSCRAILDAILLFAFSQRMLAQHLASHRHLVAVSIGTAVLLAACATSIPLAAKLTVFLAISTGFVIISFTRFITDDERRMVLAWASAIDVRIRRKVVMS